MTTQNTAGVPSQNSPFVSGPTNSITQVWYFFLQLLYARTGGISGNATILTGTMLDYGGAVVPDGYLACDGSAVSRTTYSALFQVIQTTWGSGDGATSFNLPDLRGRAAIGADSTYPLGSTGGAAQVTLNSNNNGPHTHVVDDPKHVHVLTDPTHVHGEQASTTSGGVIAGVTALSPTGTGAQATSVTTGSAATGITMASAATGITLENSGSGSPFSILSPYAAVTKMIKT